MYFCVQTEGAETEQCCELEQRVSQLNKYQHDTQINLHLQNLARGRPNGQKKMTFSWLCREGIELEA
jgi:hypothetical protein